MPGVSGFAEAPEKTTEIPGTSDRFEISLRMVTLFMIVKYYMFKKNFLDMNNVSSTIVRWSKFTKTKSQEENPRLECRR